MAGSKSAPFAKQHRLMLGVGVLVAAFLALALPGAGRRGVTSEEVQPYLERHPLVLHVVGGEVVPMPPYEPAAPARPRWIATLQWPVLAYDGLHRMWPVFIRGHQTALGSYVGILLGPLLGGGVAGVERSNTLLCSMLLPLVLLLALRSWSFRRGPAGLALLAPALLAASFGTLFFGRTGYAFELASRVMMLATLVVAAPLRPLSHRRALVVGALAAVAVLCRATIAVTLFPALAVLLMHPARPAPARRRLLVPTLMGGLPVAAVALVSAVVPFHRGTGPLADFPLSRLAERAAHAPEHLLVQLAWLGDAQSILGPVRSGGGSDAHLTAAVVVGSFPVVLSLLRWGRGAAGDGERMLVVALLGNVAVGSLLYPDSRQFQLAMALDPLVAVAVSEQIASLRNSRRAWLALLAALAIRGQSLALGLAMDARSANPIFSFRAQHGLVELARKLGLRGPELVTTSYSHAGVIEAWTGEDIRPLHAWPALEHEAMRAEALERVLRARRPRFVLLTDGVHRFEGATVRLPELTTALKRLGWRTGRRWLLPTDTQGPGFQLVEVVTSP